MKRILLSALLILSALLLISLAIFGGRMMWAKLAIDREWRSGPIQNFKLETTSKLEIIPLYEAVSTSDKFISGHGVSYLIRTDSATILMDLGNNLAHMALPPFAQNMDALGISAQEIDTIVISHPHPDHMGGMTAWKEKTLAFGEASSAFANIPIYVPSSSLLNKTLGAVVSIVPVKLSPDVATIGVISYPEVFELALYEPKGVEQALVVNVAGEGLVLITGCGHPGLKRLFIRVESLYNIPVVGVVGGLHYGDAKAADIQAQIQFLQSYQPKWVALSSHDSGPLVLNAFQSAFGNRYHTLRVGDVLQFP